MPRLARPCSVHHGALRSGDLTTNESRRLTGDPSWSARLPRRLAQLGLQFERSWLWSARSLACASSILIGCGRFFERSQRPRASPCGLVIKSPFPRLNQRSLRFASCFSARPHGVRIFLRRRKVASAVSAPRISTRAGGTSPGHRCSPFRRTGTKSPSMTCRSRCASRSESTIRTRAMRTRRVP